MKRSLHSQSESADPYLIFPSFAQKSKSQALFLGSQKAYSQQSKEGVGAKQAPYGQQVGSGDQVQRFFNPFELAKPKRKCKKQGRDIDDSEQVYVCSRPLGGLWGLFFDHAFFRVGSKKADCGPTYGLFPEETACPQGKDNKTPSVNGVPGKNRDILHEAKCVKTPIKWSCVHHRANQYPWGRYCVPGGPNSNTFVRVVRDECGDSSTKPKGSHPGFSAAKPKIGKATALNAFGMAHSVYACDEISCNDEKRGLK